MTKRSVAAIALNNVVTGPVASAAPSFEMIDPCELMVDEAYQRELSEKSKRLIRRIVGDWDWARFKPPVVARGEGGGLEVIDGQHTAIAAASHPFIERIPVMIVEARNMADRAKSFIGHNRDRIGITPTQMHISAIAAGDETAIVIDRLCRDAGIRVLKNSPPNGEYSAGDTMSVRALSNLLYRRDEPGASRVLRVLAAASLMPVTQGWIRAVEAVLFDPEYASQVDDEALEATFERFAPDEIEREASLFSASHRLPLWQAMAAILFRKTRKKRGAA